jgi:hypothetical protein
VFPGVDPSRFRVVRDYAIGCSTRPDLAAMPYVTTLTIEIAPEDVVLPRTWLGSKDRLLAWFPRSKG